MNFANSTSRSCGESGFCPDEDPYFCMKFSKACFSSGEDWSSVLSGLVVTAWLRCAASHSAAPDVAARTGTPFAQATATIDKIQTAMEIDRELSALEDTARAHGSASGAGFLYPVTVERVTQWAQGLSGRGFVLVPASAIVIPKK